MECTRLLVPAETRVQNRGRPLKRQCGVCYPGPWWRSKTLYCPGTQSLLFRCGVITECPAELEEFLGLTRVRLPNLVLHGRGGSYLVVHLFSNIIYDHPEVWLGHCRCRKRRRDITQTKKRVWDAKLWLVMLWHVISM